MNSHTPSTSNTPSIANSTISKQWYFLLFYIAGCAVLNRGFAYIGTYPIFIGEITILVTLLLPQTRRHFPAFLKTKYGALISVTFLYNALIFILSALIDPIESIRNSIYWVYLLFAYFGFAFGQSIKINGASLRLESFLLWISKAVIIYYLAYPFRDALLDSTKFLSNGTVSLIGYYSSLHATAIGFAMLPFIRADKTDAMWGTTGLLSIVLLSQARASLIGIGLSTIYLLVREHNRKFWKQFKLLVFAIAVLTPIILINTPKIEGERGEISVDLLGSMISSIFLDSGDSSFDGTKEDRLAWWEDVIVRTAVNPSTFSFGLGFNSILVDLQISDEGVLRYPHNSYISIFGFSGAIGLALYLTTFFHVFIRLVKSRRTPTLLNRWYPIFFLGFSASAFFSTVLEAPFHSAVFWTMSGIVYSLSLKPKSGVENIIHGCH